MSDSTNTIQNKTTAETPSNIQYPDLMSLGRSDLISNLTKILRILDVLQTKIDAAKATENELKELEKKGKAEAKTLPKNWKIGIGLIAGFIFCISVTDDGPFMGSIILAVIMYFLMKLFASSLLYGTFFCEKEVEAKYQVFAQKHIAPKQAILDRQLQEINAYLNTEECQWASKALPQNYFTYSTIQSIIQYLQSCRAETLKEALNLYEEEIHRQRMEDMQQQIVQSTAQTANEVNKQSSLLSDLQRTANNTNTSVKIGNLINFLKD